MNKVIVNNGTRVNLYALIDNLQTFAETNSANLFRNSILTYGFNVTYSGSTILSNELKVIHDGTTLQVNPGDVLLSGMLYMKVPITQHVSLDGVLGGDHLLYLRHKHIYASPADTISGYTKTLLLHNGGIDTYAYDGFELVWDTDPGVSGLLLADVITRDGIDVTVHDRRATNILRFAPERDVHFQNTDTHTTAPVFYIGGAPDTLMHGRIVTQWVCKPPPNFRLVDISSARTSDDIIPASVKGLAANVQRGLETYEASVLLKWNWDNVIIQKDFGLSSDEIWIYLFEGKTILAEDELVGYIFTHSSNNPATKSGWFIITTNDATQVISTPGRRQIISRTKVGMIPYGFGSTTSIADLPGSPACTGRIHSGAQEYEIEASPVVSLEGVSPERYVHRVDGDYSSSWEDYYLGEELTFKVYSRGGHWGTPAATTLAAGQYTKGFPYLSPVSYNTPTLIRPPSIDSRGAALDLQPITGGLTFNIRGWEGYEQFDLVYKVGWYEYLLFDDPEAKRYKTINRTEALIIPTGDTSMLVTVAVRPLVAGYQAAEPLCSTTNVTGPKTGPVFQVRSFPATIRTWRAWCEIPLMWAYYKLTFIDSPAQSLKQNADFYALTEHRGVTYFPPDTRPYKISAVYVSPGEPYPFNSLTVEFLPYDVVSGTPVQPTQGPCQLEFNTSELGREVFRGNLLSDTSKNHRITGVRLDITSIDNGLGTENNELVTIKVGPSGDSTEADYTQWNISTDLGKFKPIDVPVLPGVNTPDGKIVVSLYNPENEAVNRLSIIGSVSLEYTLSMTTLPTGGTTLPVNPEVQMGPNES
jgi:hypothetical protein